MSLHAQGPNDRAAQLLALTERLTERLLAETALFEARRPQEAAATLAAIPDVEIENLATGEVLFEAGERRRLFTAPEFVLSFSLPNLFFHAATTYDILRLLGVPLEKRDYLGQVPGRWV